MLLLLVGPVFVEDILNPARYETYRLLEIEIVNLNALLRTIESITNYIPPPHQLQSSY
jgi:hypothetical protein